MPIHLQRSGSNVLSVYLAIGTLEGSPYPGDSPRHRLDNLSYAKMLRVGGGVWRTGKHVSGEEMAILPTFLERQRTPATGLPSASQPAAANFEPRPSAN
jgi:hypothetical protein